MLGTTSLEYDDSQGSDSDVVVVGQADISDFNPGNILPESPNVQATIISRLSPVSSGNEVSEYQKHLSLHLPGSGDWVFSTAAYQQWHAPVDGLEHGKNVLWIRGVPGAGKSVLASALVRKLKEENCPVLSFFFRHGITANQNPVVALRDWLAQVVPFSPPLQAELKGLVQPGQPDVFSSFDDLARFLRTALSHLPKVYILVDALDEMDQESLESFLQYCKDLAEWRSREVKFIMTSRPVGRIENMLRGVHLLDIPLDQRVKSDVAAYVRHRLVTLSIPVEHHSRIVEIILRRSGGLFLYARLALDHVLEQPELDDDTLEAIPAGLSVMYANMLQEQSERRDVPPGMHQLVLECVTQATRPLRLLEIADLIHVTQDMSSEGDLGTTKSLVRSICGPLLQILPDETVHVVHHSLTEFLNGTAKAGDVNSDENALLGIPKPTHSHMALLCISYLRAGSLDSIHFEDAKSNNDRLDLAFQQASSPFARYAELNWHVHAQKATLAGQGQSEINRQILDMFQVEGNLEKIGLLGAANDLCGFTPLGLATSFGLTSLVRQVLEHAKLDNTPIAMEGPLLHAAKTYDDAEIVELLLEHGANAAVYDNYGLSPLHCAVYNGRHQVVKALLATGADAFIPKGQNKRLMGNYFESRSRDSPARHVFRVGDADMVSLFLPHLRTAKSTNWALEQAVKKQRHDTLQRLLNLPLLDVNAKVWLFTPLFIACWLRDAHAIELLLKAGADPNIVHIEEGEVDHETAEKGCNVLHALAGLGDEAFTRPTYYPREHIFNDDASYSATRRCFKLVLDAGAKLDQVDVEGRNPLHVARDTIAVECLLDAGIDPYVTSNIGKTLLHITRDENIMRVLASKMDINCKARYQGATPLLSSLRDNFYDDEACIKKACQLLDLGADAAAVDDEGNGTLHHALSSIKRMKSNGLSLLERLLAGGADANLKNNKGQTSIHRRLLGVSNSCGRSEGAAVLKMLVDAGVDIEAKDNEGRTGLLQAMDMYSGSGVKEDIKITQQLISLGAKIDTTDSEGRNPLHYAVSCRWPSVEFVQFLISLGIDPQQTDKWGNTLWHFCAPRLARAPTMVEFLSEFVSLGVDPTKANNAGESPLHIVAKFHPSAFGPCNSHHSNGRWTNADDACFFDYFVDLCKVVGSDANTDTNTIIDCVDNNGITPLHLASTFSEYLTRRLLKESADPARPTLEGLTVLHLAARSRQSNTMGLLLDWLRSSLDGPEMLLNTINMRDHLNRPALYYACASGCPETAQILLDAGASTDADSYAGSPWEGCVALQDEEKAQWRWSDSGIYGLESEPDAAGVLISDTQRIKLDLGGGNYHMRFPFPEERLDEVVDLLVAHGSRVGNDAERVKQVKYVNQAIASAVEKQFDHATECLIRARESLGVKEPYELDGETSVRLLSRRSEAPSAKKSQLGDSAAELLMSDRRYGLAVAEIVQNPSEMLLHQLVRGGFSQLLDQVARQAAEDSDAASLLVTDSRSLLVTACRRPEYNMNVVRLLAENLGVDLKASQPLSQSRFGYQRLAQPLHSLVRGGRWWQVNEALPYLLNKGANTETRDEQGMTPLAAALEAINGPHFSRKAVETLLQFKADPNATDKQGRTCLSLVGGNRDIYELLIRHGATVTPSTMVDIIYRRDIALLEAALASGVDANMRKMPEGARSARECDPYDRLEHYPLEVAARDASDHGSGDEGDMSERMIKLLLEYGANPSARYKRTTVMHRLLDDSYWTENILNGKSQVLQLLLQSSQLDLEAQVDGGMTVLHVVASHAIQRRGRDDLTLFQMLLDQGANVRARDDEAMTVLHHLLTRRYHSSNDTHQGKNPDISRVLAAAPELLHAVDNKGRTALHAGLESPLLNIQNVCEVIEAGSDMTALVESTGDSVLHLLFRQPWAVMLNAEVRVGMKPSSNYDLIQKLGGDDDDTGANEHKDEDILQMLLTKGGANVNARNRQGKTPIFGLFEQAEVSIEAVRQEDFGESFESFERRLQEEVASVEKETLIWQFLDDLGVDWTAESEVGETLLHVVAEAGYRGETDAARRVQRFRFLVSKGLDVMREDRQHRTPLDVAAAAGREEILALFKSSSS